MVHLDGKFLGMYDNSWMEPVLRKRTQHIAGGGFNKRVKQHSIVMDVHAELSCTLRTQRHCKEG